jgi:hypothetical protein
MREEQPRQPQARHLDAPSNLRMVQLMRSAFPGIIERLILLGANAWGESRLHVLGKQTGSYGDDGQPADGESQSDRVSRLQAEEHCLGSAPSGYSQHRSDDEARPRRGGYARAFKADVRSEAEIVRLDG